VTADPQGAGESGRLADNVVHFARALRRAGLPVGPAAVLDALGAVEVAGIASREDFYWTLHSVFVKKREHREVFHEAFELFFKRRGLLDKLLAALLPSTPAVPRQETPKPAAQRVAEAFSPPREREGAPTDREEIEAHLQVSAREVLQKKDFAQMSAAEIAEAERALARLVLPEDRLRTRRLKRAARGRFDARRAMRASLRVGGDIIVPAWRAPVEIAPPIVAICDISGSMAAYSRLMLHFLHALAAERRVHAFLFGTRLTNVTRQLRLKDPDAALAGCSEAVKDWAGGTRIAAALKRFNRDWSRRVLGQRATVLLITDGLEREDAAPADDPRPADLGTEMDRLRRSCRRLIWLNPLLGYEGFQPRARGIRTMLSYVDEFRPAHSVAAVADLVKALSEPTALGGDPRRFPAAATRVGLTAR
jgi:uncharacterized protein with von Willebrand factor type A (vWA) domain